MNAVNGEHPREVETMSFTVNVGEIEVAIPSLGKVWAELSVEVAWDEPMFVDDPPVGYDWAIMDIALESDVYVDDEIATTTQEGAFLSALQSDGEIGRTFAKQVDDALQAALERQAEEMVERSLGL
jgi:hypothetical protein